MRGRYIVAERMAACVSFVRRRLWLCPRPKWVRVNKSASLVAYGVPPLAYHRLYPSKPRAKQPLTGGIERAGFVGHLEGDRIRRNQLQSVAIESDVARWIVGHLEGADDRREVGRQRGNPTREGRGARYLFVKREHARLPGGEVVPRDALLDYNQSCMLPVSAIDGTPCTNGWKCSAYRHFHSAIQTEIPRMEHDFQGPTPCCCYPVAPSHSATLVASRGRPISRPSTICRCRLVAVVKAELNPALVVNEACEAIRH